MFWNHHSRKWRIEKQEKEDAVNFKVWKIYSYRYSNDLKIIIYVDHCISNMAYCGLNFSNYSPYTPKNKKVPFARFRLLGCRLLGLC